MRQTRNGFTLIELLVVISIIALLIAILLPALTAARIAAKAAVCGSNARQIAVAVHSYAQDHNGYFPYDYNGPPIGGIDTWETWWADRLAKSGYVPMNPLVKGGTAWHCPLAIDQISAPNPDPWRWRFTYSMNERLVGERDGSAPHGFRPSRPLARLEQTRPQTIMLGDCALEQFSSVVFPTPTYNGNAAYGNGGAGSTLWPFEPWPIDDTTGKARPDLHNGMTNVAGVDGHVEQLKDWNGLIDRFRLR